MTIEFFSNFVYEFSEFVKFHELRRMCGCMWVQYIYEYSSKLSLRNESSLSNPYHFFWTNQPEADFKIFSWTQCEISKNKHERHILTAMTRELYYITWNIFVWTEFSIIVSVQYVEIIGENLIFPQIFNIGL